jgi:cation transport protein ChaC
MSDSPLSPASKQFINRDTLASNAVQKLVRARGDDRTLLSDDELLASRRRLIADDYRGDIWVFAYGSLLWNPVIDISAEKMGRIYGYHRRFCLKTEVGRGSPGDPGLVLGLDQGG